MSYTQPTIDMFESLFKKPQMKDQLLQKPPFRYLHDIITATMEKVPGFAQGLYEEIEMDSKTVTERDAKINFLAKMIALAELMTGEQLDVKPAKIVAGLEPEKTNAFLQSMFKAATSKKNSLPYVKKVLGAGDEEEEDDGGAEQQRQMEEQRLQEEKQRKLQEQQERKKKDGDEKKKAEILRKKQEEEEQDRQRQEAEAMKQRKLEEEKAKKKATKKQDNQTRKIIKENEEEKEEVQQQDDQEDFQQQQRMQQQKQFQADPNDKHSAFVEETKKLMQEGEEPQSARKQKGEETGGIRMGKIGNKRKKGDPQAQQQAFTKQGVTATTAQQKPSGQALSGGSGFSESDIEFMKKAIQILCQSTNPLGKSIDFVTDDIDSMSKEFEYWKREAISCQSRLEDQQKITEEVIQPLQDQLAELEEKIKEQSNKITSIKSSIMRNDTTIQNLLYSVISTR